MKSNFIVVDGEPAADLYEGRGAELYDELCREDFAEVREIVEAVRSHSADVLELAAGSGRITLPLARIAEQVTAVDISTDLLRILAQRLASESIPNVKPIEANILDLDLGGQRFSAVVLGTTTVSIFDAQDRRRIYQAMRAHLAPGGRVVISVFESDASTPCFSSVALNGRVEVRSIRNEKNDERISLVIEFGPDGKPIGRYAGSTRLLTAAQVSDELANAGFTNVRVRPIKSAALALGAIHSLITAQTED